MIYVFDETAGPKNTDHSISYLINYIHQSERVPSWIKRVHIFLDNTVSTNKNAYFMSWAMEHVQQQHLEYLRVSFMIAGHTKFDVDRAFSATAKAYNSSDVFTTQELADVMSQSPSITSFIDDGRLVKPWRDMLQPSIVNFRESGVYMILSLYVIQKLEMPQCLSESCAILEHNAPVLCMLEMPHLR